MVYKWLACNWGEWTHSVNMVCLITLSHQRSLVPATWRHHFTLCSHIVHSVVDTRYDRATCVLCFVIANDITLRMLFQYHKHQEATAAGTAGVDLQMGRTCLVFLIHFNPLSTWNMVSNPMHLEGDCLHLLPTSILEHWQHELKVIWFPWHHHSVHGYLCLHFSQGVPRWCWSEYSKWNQL